MPASPDRTSPTPNALLHRIERDIAKLRPGASHALLLLRPGSDIADVAVATIESALTDRDGVDQRVSPVDNGAVAVWLPDTTRSRAIAEARVARFALINAAAERTSTAATSADAVSTGIVIVSAANWTAEALLQSAHVTAAFAALSGTGAIRVADQALPMSGGLSRARSKRPDQLVSASIS